MDKLQWFKFTPTDWIMGKIQRCPEITQARFMRLICLYWNKECVLSFEDAEIEIDKEHLDILIGKKIIKKENDFICIDFLNEQFKEIECSKEDKSTSAKIGNLKRWHRLIYDRFIKNEFNLEQALLIAYKSQPDNTPIASESQNIAEKRREEEEREKKRLDKEKKESDFIIFWDKYNKKQDSKKCKEKFLKLSDEEIEKILLVVDNYVKSTPDIKFRKNPATWLNGSCWNDSIVMTSNNKEVINPDNERIVVFNTNVNGTVRKLPESKFLQEQENYKDGGYIYKVLKYE